MSARLTLLAVLAAAVTLTSVAAAVPEAAKQRVAITSKGVANAGEVGRFVFTPLQVGTLKPDSGAESGSHTTRSVVRDGQDIEIQNYVTTREGKRGTFVIRSRVEYLDAGNGFHVGTNTWTLVRGTGQYAKLRGGGRGGDVYTDGGRWSDRFEGFLTVP
jgi:hypothetical protein